jgi:hypothetical protein
MVHGGGGGGGVTVVVVVCGVADQRKAKHTSILWLVVSVRFRKKS